MDKNDLSLLWCKQYIDKRLKGIGNVDTSIKPGSVGTAELADSSVTADKLADGSVTLGKLAQEVLELFYQPGSLFINANDINPKELFGFGEWVRIKDRFLLAAGDTYQAGRTGGEATHTLTVNEMPRHGHTQTGISSGAQNSAPICLRTQNDGNFVVYNSDGTALWSSQTQTSATFKHRAVDIGSDGATSDTGGNAAHNNMPPYQTFYVWMRVS